MCPLRHKLLLKPGTNKDSLRNKKHKHRISLYKWLFWNPLWRIAWQFFSKINMFWPSNPNLVVLAPRNEDLVTRELAYERASLRSSSWAKLETTQMSCNRVRDPAHRSTRPTEDHWGIGKEGSFPGPVSRELCWGTSQFPKVTSSMIPFV